MNGEFLFEKSSYDDFVMIIINKNSSNIALFDDLFSTGMRQEIEFYKNKQFLNYIWRKIRKFWTF